MKKRAILFTSVLVCFTFALAIAALDARAMVEGYWKLEGKQTNHIGTPEEHVYDYFYKRRWGLSGEKFSVNGHEYTETRVSGDVIEATDRRDDGWVSIRIRFLDENTVEFTSEGENSVFGRYEVKARGTRIQ